MDSRSRVERLVIAARRIADPNDTFGRRARERLAETTGLSAQGIELGFEHFETRPTESEIDALCGCVPRVERAHVLLSANVFIAAHRAIALALAASERVSVRPSRRDPVLAELLGELTGAFELVSELAPEPGSHVWAYGSDETLSEVRAALPPSVVVHAHGSGIGVAVVDTTHGDVAAQADALARDVIVFDQRGCLSPRIVFFVGERAEARCFADALALALDRWQEQVPRGKLDADELAAVARYRDTAAFTGEVFAAGAGFVTLDDSAAVLIPPVGRIVRIAACSNALAALRSVAGAVTVVGTACDETLASQIQRVVPGARLSALGAMQRPPFDGPVDRRDTAPTS